MNAEDKFEQILSEFEKKYLYELIYIPIFAAIVLSLEFGAGDDIPSDTKFIMILACIGSIHILASRILSFMYNLNWVILPFAIKTNHKGLRILGLVVFCFSGIFLIIIKMLA